MTGTATPAQIYQQVYSYDKFGNRKLDQAQTWGTGINGSVAADIYDVDKPTNRLAGMVYDAAGNLVKSKPISPQPENRTYDAENRMTFAQLNGGTGYYVYDGDGRRVRRIANGVENWQVYGIDGELLAEYQWNGTTASLKKEYGYRDGQLLVVADPTETNANKRVQWLIADHLGTPRMMVDKTGSLSGVTRHDYLPFGEELVVGMGNGSIRSVAMGYQVDSVRQKFTGYERDGETGLDFAQARYYANVQGRFTSVDPFNPIFETEGSAFIDWISEPGRWNRYSYALNNPLKYVDVNGEDPLQIIKDGSRRIAQLIAKIAQRNAGRVTHPLVMAAEVLKTALELGFPSLNVVTNGLQGNEEIAGARLAAAFEGKSFEGVASQNTPGIDGFLYPGSSFSTAVLRGLLEPVQLQNNGPSKDTLGNIVNLADAHEGKVIKGGQKQVHLFVTVTDPNVTASQVIKRVQGDANAGFGIVKMTTNIYIPKVTILTTDGAVRVQNGKIYSCDGNGNCTAN